MSTWYRFTQDLEVTDTGALYAAARACLIKDLGDRGVVEGLLGTSKDPNIPACIEAVMDPGESPPGTGLGHSAVTLRA
jgi:hypothetical protein